MTEGLNLYFRDTHDYAIADITNNGIAYVYICKKCFCPILTENLEEHIKWHQVLRNKESEDD
jgi:hypothetical protein